MDAISTEYLVGDPDYWHGLTIYDSFSSRLDAESYLAERKVKYPDSNSQGVIYKVEIIKVDAIYQDEGDEVVDNEFVVITVKSIIDNEDVDAEFTVQLDDGEYQPEKGCMIMAYDDNDFSAKQTLIFYAIDGDVLAERTADAHRVDEES